MIMQNLTTTQQIFMLFFAICWGAMANVQPRWKAFQFPLFCRWKYARHRVMLSFSVLNVAPIVFFGYVMWVLSAINTNSGEALSLLVVHGVVPAFAAFGFYRIWLGIVEIKPNWFYLFVESHADMDDEYKFVEPMYAYRPVNPPLDGNRPIVYIGKNSGWANLLCGLLYVIIGVIVPWAGGG